MKWSIKKPTLCLLMISILFSWSAPALAKTPQVDATISNTKKQTIPLTEALEKLAATTDLEFTYRIDIVEKIQVSYRSKKSRTPLQTLEKLLKNTGLQYKVFSETRVVIYQKNNPEKISKEPIGSSDTEPRNTLVKQKLNPSISYESNPEKSKNPRSKKVFLLEGQITDSKGEALIGANVYLKDNPSNGTITDYDGNYKLELESLSGTLVFSYLGYLNHTEEINGRTQINVVLVEDVQALDEVVVVGYGTQRKSDIIGAVSSVDGEDLNTTAVSNFDAALQGLAAGVSILSQSGKPGAPSTIRIRGANSIQSSTDPLWVIDGMPVFSSPTGLGSSNQNPMSLINPNDIESIQVLKDAAATSIYGSRGSNGVIIVTTKSGKNGKGTLNLSVSGGISTPTRTPEDIGYANTQEWLEIMDEAYQTSFGRDFKMNDYYQFAPLAFDQITREQIENQSINTNWFDEVFRTGSFNEINLSSSRGTEKGSYYISGNYRSDKGVLDHNQLDRLSLRANVNFEPLENLTIDTKLNFSFTDNERRSEDLTTLIKFSLPWQPVRDLENPNRYFNPYTGSNLVALNDPNNTLNNVKQYRALGNIAIQYNLPFIKGMALRSEFSADIIQSNLVNWSSRNIQLDGNRNPIAEAREEAVTYQSVNYNFYTQYARDFSFGSLNAVLGVEAQRINQYERILAGEGLVGDYQELGSPKTPTTVDARQNNERYLLGYFGRINYKLQDKYLLGLSARRDGSSAFSATDRWGNFVAVSAGWILSEEDFMTFLDNKVYLKLRASFGETGNQSVPNNLQSINFFDRVIYGNRAVGSNGTIPSNLAVDNLTWESTQSADFGIDFGLFNNRIYGTLAYYHRFVNGMLLEAQLPTSAGVSPDRVDADFGFLNTVDGTATNKIWTNIGNMTNSGLEIELNSVNVDQNDFKWTTSFNISFNDNRVESLTADLDQSGTGITTPYSISRKGNRRNVWYIAEFAGINSDNGVPYIYALDKDWFAQTGDTRRLLSESGEEVQILGTRTNIRENRFIQDEKSSDPTYFGGLTNKFEYKGFDFSAFLAFSGGGYLLDYDRQVAIYPNETRMILSDVLNNSWQERGDEAQYPATVARRTFEVEREVFLSDFGEEDVFTDRELWRSDFIRLRNLTLGYTFSADKLERFKLQGLRIYLTANNLFTITDYPGFDPEGIPNQLTRAHILYNNTPIPQLKSYLFGLNLKI